MPIGIFDSGFGGLTVYNAVSQKLPEIELIYFGDNQRAPYGNLSEGKIYQYTAECICNLWGRGCQLIILACNTASAVALRKLQEDFIPDNKRVLGVFVPTIESIIERNWGDNSPPREVSVKRVALFATPATVASRAFQRELAFRAIGVDVESQPCEGLVEAIEKGNMVLSQALAKSHVDALLERMPNPEVVVLGCTHYPIVENAFREALDNEIKVISQPKLVADSLVDYLKRHSWIKTNQEKSSFITTADPKKISNKATLFLKREISFTAAN